jgi:hypothetical protein
MKHFLRFLAVFLVLGGSGGAFFGCFGGPGVEPPFSGEGTGNAPPPGLGDGFSPATGGGGAGEEQAADSRDSEQAPEPGATGEPANEVDTGGFAPTSAVGDGGVPADAGDGGGVSEGDAGDAGDPGDAGWVQEAFFFE